MSYIGNPPVNGVFRKLDTIAASFNGSTTSFNLTSGGAPVTPGLTTNLIISLGGIIQEPNTAYTVNGSVISFTAAPPAGTSFWGIQLGDVGLASTPNQAAMTTQVFTATAGQTTFTVAGGYTAGQIQVLRNGVQLVVGVDVTATNGTTFVLANAATAGDTLVAVIYTSFIVANAVAKSGDTMTGDLDIMANLGVGTLSPAVKIHAYGTGSSARVRTESASGVIMEMLADTATAGVISTNSAHPIIFQTNSVARATLDTNGFLLTPAQPCFSIQAGGSSQSGGTVIQFNSAQTNVGNYFNTSTYRFTAPVAGNYLFVVSSIGTTGATTSFYVRRNGGTRVSGVAWGGITSSAESSGSTNCIVTAAAGDYFDVYTNTATYNATYSNFAGFLIG